MGPQESILNKRKQNLYENCNNCYFFIELLCNAICKCYWVTYFFTYSGGKIFNKNLMKTKEGFYIHWKKDVINSIKWIQETQIEGPIIFLMEDL